MKKVEITAYGAPEEIAHCIDVPDVGHPTAGEIVFDILAFPINPADISFCRGNYRLRPPLPATPGAEGIGRVASVGAGVTGLKPGDLVIDGPTLAKIFLGEIKKWNDPAIAKLNGSVKLPDQAIAIVHRSDGSGTTFN